MNRTSALLSAALSMAMVLTGCGGSSNIAPTAQSASYQTAEDTQFLGSLSAADADGDALQFVVATEPSNGSATLEARAGTFSYTPRQDFNGTDSFRFAAVDAKGARSLVATISISVTPVNDSPVIAVAARLENSGYAQEVVVPFTVTDADGDQVSWSVASLDQNIGMVTPSEAFQFSVRQGRQGDTTIVLSATDGQTSIEHRIPYSVLSVTQRSSLTDFVLGQDAIEVENRGDTPVEFKLAQNGSALAASYEDLLSEVALMPEEVAGETRERKLWRYVRDRTYHWHSITEQTWQHDPLRMLNSIGFGLCDDVSSVLVLLARASGLSARIWGLNGHVVAELGSPDAGHVFDPDLATYYKTPSGDVASIVELQLDPSLIYAPIEPVLPTSSGLGAVAYSTELSGYYGTSGDNAISEWHVENVNAIGGGLTLPPSSRLTFPVRVRAAVSTQGGVGANAPHVAGLRMTLPVGFAGTLRLPLRVIEVRGSGRVNINGNEWEANSPVLAETLSETVNWIDQLTVMRADTELEIVFLLNPIRFPLNLENTVSLSGVDVWRLSARKVALSADDAMPPGFGAAALRIP